MEQGFNHNIEHGSVLFHVQTEDSGRGSPVIRTHLFFEGQIITSLKIVMRKTRSGHRSDRHESTTQGNDRDVDRWRVRHPDSRGGDQAQSTWPIEVPAWLSKHPPPLYA